MSAGVEDRGGHDPHAGTGLAPHPAHRASRTHPRIPASPVTAPRAHPEPTRPDPERPGPAQSESAQPESAEPESAQSESVGSGGADGAAGTTGKHHHHVLIEPDEDRWAWRRRIRQNRHQLRVYRVGVGVLGMLLICLGLVTGPLPGPGGIPLVLLGLAIWSSEFEWAYKLRQRFKAEVKKFRGWTTAKKVAFWVVFFAACGCLGYAYLLTLGMPFWMPDVGASLLEHLPGVEAPS